MKSPEIRKRFFSFFTSRGHEQVASSSLIPAQDPTLLFANAGMNQFKDVFLGLEKRSYTRATSIQKCVRAGGKHNDLDNVGFTKRHLTFFEMMGNFSFGDYFKEEAIAYAWDFITKELAIAPDNLHVSVYKTDDDAYAIWHKKIGIPADKIHRLGESENFWQMGDVGPCGPCTEIHIDRGAAFGCADNAGCSPACDCDRFLEIWNLVFMEFDRQQDGTLNPLAKKGVDTGMGLERLCAVMQDRDSVFETDLFESIIQKTEQLSGLTYSRQPKELQAAFNVLADHIRSSTLLISDGCAPSNDGRGYVLRKIIRRAALFAQKLSADNIFPQLARVVVADMSPYYPELKTNEELIVKVLTSEIEKFATNLVRGQHILADYFKQQAETKTISGLQAFKLYDTYGFPIELIHLISNEHGYTVDADSFERHMQEQKEKSGKKISNPLDHLELHESITTEFTGYSQLQTESTVSALVVDGQLVPSVSAGTMCWVIAAQSPFFIVGGGQVPDQGWLTFAEYTVAIESVRYISGRIAALITTPTSLTVGDTIVSKVDETWRTKAMKNHTATHLLQAALIELFGNQIKQSGSLVHPDYLRFDFTYHENLKPEDIARVERLVNEKIMQNIPVNIAYTSLREATKKGALAFFGDKYNPEQVRMVQVDDFSVELCGGTHVHATGDIGAFKIVEATALSAGHRRIVAVTGPKALELFQELFNSIKTISTEFKVQREDVVDAISKQKELVKTQQAEIKQLKQNLMKLQLPAWKEKIQTINGIPFAYIAIESATPEELNHVTQELERTAPGFYFLVSGTHNPTFLATISDSIAPRIAIKEFADWLHKGYGLRGGVQKNSLRGGGSMPIDSNLEHHIKTWINHLS